MIVGLKDVDHPLGEFAGFGVKTIVKKRLPAAGLHIGEDDAPAVMLQNFGNSHANARVELVGETGDEQCCGGLHIEVPDRLL